MVRRERYNLNNPETALSLFRHWCLRRRVVPDYATIEDLDRFGYALLEDGYSPDEVEHCKYMIFNRL